MAPARPTVAPAPLTSFFHPLDVVDGWNRAYGSGRLPAVPGRRRRRRRSSATCSTCSAGSGVTTFLPVLKRFGTGIGAPLSFPTPGWTLAVDVPADPTRRCGARPRRRDRRGCRRPVLLRQGRTGATPADCRHVPRPRPVAGTARPPRPRRPVRLGPLTEAVTVLDALAAPQSVLVLGATSEIAAATVEQLSARGRLHPHRARRASGRTARRQRGRWRVTSWGRQARSRPSTSTPPTSRRTAACSDPVFDAGDVDVVILAVGVLPPRPPRSLTPWRRRRS